MKNERPALLNWSAVAALVLCFLSLNAFQSGSVEPSPPSAGFSGDHDIDWQPGYPTGQQWGWTYVEYNARAVRFPTALSRCTSH